MNMKQLLFGAALITGVAMNAQDLAPGINYSYNPPGSDALITDITVDVVENDGTAASSFDVSMHLYDQSTQNYWIIGTQNIPSLSGWSLITISNWDIDIDDTPGIPAGTYRLGIWVDSNDDISESDENNNAGLLAGNINYNPTSAIEDMSIVAASVNCFPNPANVNTTLSFEMNVAGDVTIEVYDVLGNLVSMSSEGNLAPGQYQRSISTENLAPGIYFVSLVCGDAKISRRISVAH